MKLTLSSPSSFLHWMLIAEGLQDPADWSIFLLNHGPETERYRFEEAVQRASDETDLALATYRLMCKRGVCAMEYSRAATVDLIKAHANRVAELLSGEIEVHANPTPTTKRTG